ncbi:MAG: type II toxin-antitoxin system VapC family toxin [Actinomycetota bacterium]|nr:type II toxin-antitoxin system VapC family toxin [Actinomycetota bacterium]
MTLLLDTHTLLWWLAGERLEGEASERIADRSTLVAVSAASIWESAIKSAVGKLDVPEPLGRAAMEEGFAPLHVTFDHAELAGRLPKHHRDPFDRMLVAQAQTEGLAIVTRDPAFDAYDVEVLTC